MKRNALIISLVSSCLVMSTSASLPPPGNPVPAYEYMRDRLAKEAADPSGIRDAPTHEQVPLEKKPNIALPADSAPSNDSNNDNDAPPNPPSAGGGVTISDVLPSSRNIGIFSGLTRDFAPIARRLEDGAHNSTILAPGNAVMKALPRKPWEDPDEYARLGAAAYAGGDGEDRAHRNLRRFVEMHVVPASPWAEGEKMENLAGATVWWEKRDGKRFIQPGNVEVDTVANSVSNGEIWILKGVVDAPI